MKQKKDSVYRRSFARIDLSNLEYNFDLLSSFIPAGTKKMAVVKADAYGHGAVPVAKTLHEKADYFGVACIEEALDLRQGGIKKPILILSYTHPSQFEDLIREDLTATVYSFADGKMLGDKAQAMGKKAKVHFAVDTGMGRIGFIPGKEAVEEIASLSRHPGLCAEGIFSHYALADAPTPEVSQKQREAFDGFLKDLSEKGVNFAIRHISNSAGTMYLDSAYDMCRFGIAMYGLHPSDERLPDSFDLRPAMEVVSHVVHTKTVPAGTPIGYGHIYTTPSEKRIATVSIGYADGFNRNLTGKGEVLIRGKRAKLVGKVCMDQIMVDITDIPEVEVADEAVVLGRSGEEEITAEYLGSLSDSFHYEVICTYLPRVGRIYIKSGKEIEI